MRPRTFDGMPSHRQRPRRAVAALAAAGVLLLAACSDEDPVEDPGQSDGAGDEAGGSEDAPATGGNGSGGSDGEDSSAAPAPGPSEPADITPVPGDRSASSSGGTITVEGDQAAFVSPSGNIACVVSDAAATCQLTEQTYTAEAHMLVPDAGPGCTIDKADAMTTVEESAAWTCVGQDLTAVAAVDHGGWWVEEVAGQTEEHDGATTAVLPYGQTLQVGNVSCSSSEAGMTCRNPDMGNRQIRISRDSYQYGRY